MGCGSTMPQVDIGREGGFRPIHLLQMSETEVNIGQSKVYLFGQTRTQRRILECDMKSSTVKNISTRARIPFPKIHLDPIETMYQESQQIFHLGIYGFSRQPPFNDMLTLFLQRNLLFMCGGRDYEGYNIKNDAFFYSIVPQPLKISNEMIHSSQMSERTFEHKPKYPNNKFQKMSSMNKPRYSHTGIYCSNNKAKNIFVFGGKSEKGEILDSCEMYNILQNSWREIPAMKKPRAHAHCFQYGNKIYVFGGRSSKEKLSKKIETLDLDTLQWFTLSFKLHRGIQDAILFSQQPNEILIVGGNTNYQPCRSVIKVDLHNQTYVWDSDISYDYNKVKGVVNNLQIVIFGGQRQVSQIYYNNTWKQNVFDHLKIIDLDDIQKFSFSKENIVVKAVEVGSELSFNNLDEELFFGNDIYPCLFFYNRKTGEMRKEPVPLKIRLKSNMGIIQYQKGVYMLIGGSDKTQNKCSRSCFFYNRHRNVGETGLKMDQKRTNFAYTMLNNHVYVFGGFSSAQNRALSSCQRYSFKLQKWEQIKDMKNSRSKAFAQNIGKEKIAIMEGQQSLSRRELEIYDTTKGQFQTLIMKDEIKGTIIMSYTKATNEIFLFRRDEDKNYFECQVILTDQKKEIKTKLTQNKIKEDENNIQIYNIQKEKTVEPLTFNSNPKQQESQQSRDLHKISKPVESLEPTMITIQKKKKIDEKMDGIVQEEEYQEEIQMERVAFDDNIVEEINKSGNYLIQDIIHQEIMENLGEESEPKPSEQSEIQSPLSPDISRKISQKLEKIKVKSLDNQSKGGEEQQIQVKSEIRLQNKGKPIQWLQNEIYNVIKRGKLIYFLNESKVISYDTQTTQIEEKSIEQMNVKIFELL